MPLIVEVKRGMRLKIGDGVFVYTEKPVNVKIEADKGIPIRREYKHEDEETGEFYYSEEKATKDFDRRGGGKSG